MSNGKMVDEEEAGSPSWPCEASDVEFSAKARVNGMSELPEQLRVSAESSTLHIGCYQLMLLAANEIEFLQQQLAEAREANEQYVELLEMIAYPNESDPTKLAASVLVNHAATQYERIKAELAEAQKWIDFVKMNSKDAARMADERDSLDE